MFVFHLKLSLMLELENALEHGNYQETFEEAGEETTCII